MNDWMDNGRIETRVREREKNGGGGEERFEKMGIYRSMNN